MRSVCVVCWDDGLSYCLILACKEDNLFASWRMSLQLLNLFTLHPNLLLFLFRDYLSARRRIMIPPAGGCPTEINPSTFCECPLFTYSFINVNSIINIQGLLADAHDPFRGDQQNLSLVLRTTVFFICSLLKPTVQKVSK